MEFKANPDKGIAYSQLVIKKLKRLGYKDARGELIDMSAYGIPQRRTRFIVIATREGLADSIFTTLERIKTEYTSQNHLSIKSTVRDALSDLERCHGVIPCPDTPHFFSGVLPPPLTHLQQYLRSGVKEESPNSHRFVKHTKAVEAVFLKLLAEAPRNCCISGDDRLHYGLKKRSVTVLDANEAAPTVTTIPDDFVHYSEPRVMTVRECARLQTFPDWFEFRGPYTTGGKLRTSQTPRYTQVGNAVPPLFANMIGLSLREVLKK